jgi:hypothetical protein
VECRVLSKASIEPPFPRRRILKRGGKDMLRRATCSDLASLYPHVSGEAVEICHEDSLKRGKGEHLGDLNRCGMNPRKV